MKSCPWWQRARSAQQHHTCGKPDERQTRVPAPLPASLLAHKQADTARLLPRPHHSLIRDRKRLVFSSLSKTNAAKSELLVQ